MRFLSWNVQYGKSSDGEQDFSRTLEHVRSLGDFDVICLQELARYMPEYCAPDQLDHLFMTKQAFGAYEAVWGAAFSWPGDSIGHEHRQEFGNVSLVKSDLLDFRVHPLPSPATPGKYQMPRIAVETSVASSMGPISIFNTHLAFHDEAENQQQVEHLARLERQRKAQQREPRKIGSGTYQAGFPPTARLLCGDFNFTPDTPQYQYQLGAGWADAWPLSHGDTTWPATCGIFDTAQWPQGSHCRDYFWLSPELQALPIDIAVDTATRLSDHQPVMLEIST